MTDLGATIRARRTERDMTANQVAVMVGVSEAQVLHWEAGRGIGLKSRQKLYGEGLLPLGALTGSDSDWDTYLKEPAA